MAVDMVAILVIYLLSERQGSGDPTPCGGYPGPPCSTYFHSMGFFWQAATQMQIVYSARESPVPNSNTSSEDVMPDKPVDIMALYGGPSSPLIA